MKVIKYNLIEQVNTGTDESPVWEDRKGAEVEMGWNEVNEEIAKAEAWNGEYTIEDDGQPDPAVEPTQLDRIEAQTTYTAMMTDTLLEV